MKQEEVKHKEVKQEEAWMGAGAEKINIGTKLLFLLGAELFICRSKRNFFPGQNCCLWPEQSCKELLIHNPPVIKIWCCIRAKSFKKMTKITLVCHTGV